MVWNPLLQCLLQDEIPKRGIGGSTTPIFFPTVQDMFGCWKKSYGNGISGTTLKQSHTLQLPMYWVIQSAKIQTGSKNMMKRSSHWLLRNRRLTCNTWHVACNITKWLFSLSEPKSKRGSK